MAAIPPAAGCLVRSLCVALCLLPAARAQAGSLIEGPGVEGYESLVYLPEGHDTQRSAPLVVALHGCKQDSRDFARGTAFGALADRDGFVVLYPETRRPAYRLWLNPHRCWEWWTVENQARGAGEPAVLVEMIAALKSSVKIDAGRVYVTGLSAGGAMSAILGSLYPEVFAATGVHSGLAYAAAEETVPSPAFWPIAYWWLGWTAEAGEAMEDGGPDPDGRGALAYERQGGAHRVSPVIVVQGAADDKVAPRNAEQVIAQFAQMNDLADDGDGANDSIDAVADATEAVAEAPDRHPYTVLDYRSDAGGLVMRKVLVDGLEHAWSGGDPDGSFTDEKGPAASRLMWEFFKGHRLGGS
jgi:poly(hydroxyalkanoate) depolymerase family esterase